MRVLVLGGTRFIGRALVASALDAGYDVTVSNRGRTDADAFGDDVETLVADRDLDGPGGLTGALGERTWDAVIDANGYLPEVVDRATTALADRTDRYVFISTGSVYEHPLPVLADEDAPQLPEAPAGATDVDALYGELKVGCERVVREAFGDRATILRPGIVFGAHDYTDRATWWVRMLAREPAVLVPDDPQAWTQLVDARDLADFAMHTVANDLAGPYNVVGTPVNLVDFVAMARIATGSEATVVRASTEELLDAEVRPHQDLPLWVEPADSTFKRRSHGRAAQDGLLLRPITDTLREIAEWDADRDEDLQSGLTPSELDALIRRLSD